ncbi:polyprenyl synthetase [Cephaloticoccus primus]|uniref:Polyprenyl synthetase n=1 Tax=Cephaloticoccus primus TaxID=1548207 RepID=A0A139STH4_9BACT|nr:polyprenyl synthetase family protein [Cephaloticoccus primus]KXU37865.1 polyprenyl synthetase [Cephaloticoccus primus]
MSLAEPLARYTAQIEQGLDALLPTASTRPARLHEAMRYAVLGGGKRLRPILTLAAAELFDEHTHLTGGQRTARPINWSAIPTALPAAVAIECLHTYSLVHDDLPCMDNDDLRRGRPTTHRAFDEATALLAGDALLTHAFALLQEHYAHSPALALALSAELASAAGSHRLIGGQMEDLLAEKNAAATTPETLDFIHLNKTAAMLEAALVMGGLIGIGPEPPDWPAAQGRAQSAAAARPHAQALDALRRAGRHLGLAFQIVDDILDATADTQTLGKTAGKDAHAGKLTYVKHYGLKTAQRLAEEQTEHALDALRKLPGDTRFLLALTHQLTTRKK